MRPPSQRLPPSLSPPLLVRALRQERIEGEALVQKRHQEELFRQMDYHQAPTAARRARMRASALPCG